MTEKGFETEITLDETPNLKINVEKPLKDEDKTPKKVDINVLKKRFNENQNKENRKNAIIIGSVLFLLLLTGIFVSI